MELPKLYRVVTIHFWSLRDQLGANLGVIHDCDVVVERKAMRALCDDGWKWCIKNLREISEYDYSVIEDQYCLDNLGMDDVEEWCS